MFVGKGIMSTFADNYTMSTFADNPNISTYVDSDTNVACLAAKAVDRDAMGRGHLEGMTSAPQHGTDRRLLPTAGSRDH
jgi:hypothetical protein